MSREAARILFFISCAFGLYAWWLVSWSFYEVDPDGDAVYRGSDNCGMITPYVSDATNRCCAERARAYWLGGDVFVRDRVDTDFDMCRQATHESTNIDVLDVYFGVRDTLSTPYLHTPLRWGGGQAYGRGYR